MVHSTGLDLGGTPSQIIYLPTTTSVGTYMIGPNASINAFATNTLSVGSTIYSMCQSQDGNLLFVGTSTVINMYMKTGTSWTFITSATHNLSSSIQTLRISPNGRWLLALNASTGLRLYAVTPGTISLAQSYTTTVGSFNSCTWMPDSVFFITAASAGFAVHYINSSSGTITLSTSQSITGGTYEVAYLPNEASKITVAASYTGSPYMKIVQFSTVPGNGFAVNEATGYYNSATIFSNATAYNYTVTGATTAGRGVTVNNTGTLIAAAGAGSQVFTYNGVPTGQNGVTFGSSKAFSTIQYNLAFSPDGTQLMSGPGNLSITPVTGNTLGTSTVIATPTQSGTSVPNSWGKNWTGN